jgi:hypothetical protein
MLTETEPVEVLPSVSDVGERSNTSGNMAFDPRVGMSFHGVIAGCTDGLST